MQNHLHNRGCTHFKGNVGTVEKREGIGREVDRWASGFVPCCILKREGDR